MKFASLKLYSVRRAINVALAIFCGCLQMIATATNTISTITETQSKLHHLRACREPAALDMKMLRATAKKTVKRTKVLKFNSHGNHVYSDCYVRMSLTNNYSRNRHVF